MPKKFKAWKPDKGATDGPQRRLLHDYRHVYEVLCEGSVGSGKTDPGVMGAVYYREYRAAPSFVALILRHDEKDLDKHILSLVERPGYFKRYAGGSLNRTKLIWTFRSGGIAIFTHAKRMPGLHGPEFTWVWWDELTHWTGTGWNQVLPPKEYLFVNFTRVRSAAGLPCRVRAGTNAYGPGRPWVKQRWGPWLKKGASYLEVPEGAPPQVRVASESMRALIEAGHVPAPREGAPLVPSGEVLWYHPHEDGTETWEPPPRDHDDQIKRGLLSRTCLRTRTSDNVALAQGDPQYELRVRAAGALLAAQLGGSDWDAEEEGGEVFQREWFPIIPKRAVPPLAGIVSRWDFAWSRHQKGSRTAERSPWSVRVKLGWTHKEKGRGRRWYLLHVVRRQGPPNVIMPLVHQTAKADGIAVPVLAPVDFSAGKVVLSDLRNLLEGFQVLEQREHGEKDVRIKTLQTPAQSERIFLVEGEWNHDFLDEAERYPRRPNDQLDALAGAYLHVIEQEGGLVDDEVIDEAFEDMSPLARSFSGGSGAGAAQGQRRRPAEDWDDDDDDDFGGRGGGFGYGVPG